MYFKKGWKCIADSRSRNEQSTDTVGVDALATVPVSGASGSGLGGDVWAGTVGREYRINDVMQCVVSLRDRRCVEIQWLIIIL